MGQGSEPGTGLKTPGQLAAVRAAGLVVARALGAAAGAAAPAVSAAGPLLTPGRSPAGRS